MRIALLPGFDFERRHLMPEGQHRDRDAGLDTHIAKLVKETTLLIDQVLPSHSRLGQRNLQVDVAIAEVEIFGMMVVMRAYIVAAAISDYLHSRPA